MRMLRRGSSPIELSQAVAIGTLTGIFPIIGLSTVVCLGFGRLFKLNLPIMVAVSYLMLPVQIVMVYMFVQIGTLLLPLSYPMDYAFFKTLMEKDLMIIIHTLGYNLVAAVLSWLVFSFLLYFPLTNFLKWMAIRWHRRISAV